MGWTPTTGSGSGTDTAIKATRPSPTDTLAAAARIRLGDGPELAARRAVGLELDRDDTAEEDSVVVIVMAPVFQTPGLVLVIPLTVIVIVIDIVIVIVIFDWDGNHRARLVEKRIEVHDFRHRALLDRQRLDLDRCGSSEYPGSHNGRAPDQGCASCVGE
ncbi:MAG: hypothetical protein GY939_12930 [Actinomycetia bacterium]|nr:hypothetical protein [Actinomycetes bacterium]